jgi:hypothetical protein
MLGFRTVKCLNCDADGAENVWILDLKHESRIHFAKLLSDPKPMDAITLQLFPFLEGFELVEFDMGEDITLCEKCRLQHSPDLDTLN